MKEEGSGPVGWKLLSCSLPAELHPCLSAFNPLPAAFASPAENVHVLLLSLVLALKMTFQHFLYPATKGQTRTSSILVSMEVCYSLLSLMAFSAIMTVCPPALLNPGVTLSYTFPPALTSPL